MNSLALHLCELRHPFPYIVTLLVELLALQQRVEDAEVRLRIHTRGGRETPAAVVGREVAVDEMFHEQQEQHGGQ